MIPEPRREKTEVKEWHLIVLGNIDGKTVDEEEMTDIEELWHERAWKLLTVWP